MLKILQYPNYILRERMPEFDFSNPQEDPVQLEKEMLQIMYDNFGIGLSANQIGKKMRVFVMGNPEHPEDGRAFFNPEIIATTEELINDTEGCLSFKNVYVKVKRPSAIKARWQNNAGVWEEGEFNNYACKCFLHELDHLEGIVFLDRISNLKKTLAMKKLKKKEK